MTGDADVQIRGYLTELCDSIAASMIRDPDQLTLTVIADESLTDSGRSVSLGLMVTELVINALKHAFPDDRVGTIKVAYRTLNASWSLSVADDGVGMPDGVGRPGLGTSIVRALATQLRADVKLVDMKPGTAVWISQSGSTDAAPAPERLPLLV